MLFKNVAVNEVYEEVDLNELEQYAKKNEFPYYNDPASQWNAYANKRAEEEGLDLISCRSFGYLTSSLIGGLGYSCGTEMYIRESDLEYHLIDEYNIIQKENVDTNTQIRKLFEYALDIYKFEIDKYAYKDTHISMKISNILLDKFMNVDGDSKADKFRTLMEFYLRNHK